MNNRINTCLRLLTSLSKIPRKMYRWDWIIRVCKVELCSSHAFNSWLKRLANTKTKHKVNQFYTPIILWASASKISDRALPLNMTRPQMQPRLPFSHPSLKLRRQKLNSLQWCITGTAAGSKRSSICPNIIRLVSKYQLWIIQESARKRSQSTLSCLKHWTQFTPLYNISTR